MTKPVPAFHVRVARSIGCLVTLLACLGACAPLRSEPSFQRTGNADPSSDRGVIARFEGSSTDQEPRARVFLDAIPEGIAAQNGALVVIPGYAHQVIGTFTLGPQDGTFWMWLARFFDYEDGWRRGLCYPQVPLEWVSLGLWTAVPTSYACHPTASRDKVNIVRDVKLLAVAAGADGALMSYLGTAKDEARGATGVFVRLDPRTPAQVRTTPFFFPAPPGFQDARSGWK